MTKVETKQELAALRASRRGYREKLRDAREQLRRLRHLTAVPEYRTSKRKWAVPVDQPMLLISQIQRAGGTLLSRLFDAHPECFAHPMELKWGRPAKWNWPSFDADAALTERGAFALLDEMWLRKMIRYGGYSKYPQWDGVDKPAHRPRYPFAFDRQLQLELFADAYTSRRIGSRRDVLNAYLTSLFNAWLDYQNLYSTPKRWVTCFIPGLIRHPDSLERYFEDYPDGRMITIIRHPGAWFASASRHTFGGNAFEALEHWDDSVNASLAAAERYGDRVMTLVFDDLILDTEATMRAVCRWMSLTFHESLLRPTYNSMAVLSDSSFSLAAGIDSAVTRRYQSVLTPEQMSQVNARALPRYEELAARFRIATVASRGEPSPLDSYVSA